MLVLKDIKVIKYPDVSIITEFAGEDLWRLKNPVVCPVQTNYGVLTFIMQPGFPTNMRSGSHILDWIIPKFTGDNLYNLAILVHDFCYTLNRFGGHYVSRLLADLLLREMTRASGTLNAFQRAVMYRALRMFGNSAYECENTGDYAGAENFMHFRHDAK